MQSLAASPTEISSTHEWYHIFNTRMLSLARGIVEASPASPQVEYLDEPALLQLSIILLFSFIQELFPFLVTFY